MSPELKAALAAAQRATLDLHGLMVVHGIHSFGELHLLLAKPAGLGAAQKFWSDRMVDLIRAMAGDEGIGDPTKLSERDQIALTHRAYDLVMS